MTWYVQDSYRQGSRRCHVHCFGKTSDNVQVQVTAPYDPYFYVGGRKDGDFANQLREAMRSGGIDPVNLILHQCSTEHKFSFLGFTNSRIPVTKLRFMSKKAFTFAKKHLATHEVLYESNVDIDLQFLHEYGLKSVGWLILDEGVPIHNQYDKLIAYCHGNQIHNGSQKASVPCVLASYDIEAFSDTNSFPDPDRSQDVVFMVATSFQTLGTEVPFEQHLVVLDDFDSKLCQDRNLPLTVERAHSERHLIELWADRLLKNKTDVLIAYNNFGFDDRYLDTRYRQGNTSPPWESGIPLSRIFKGAKPERAWIKRQRSEFAGFADSKILVTPGIWNLDLLVVIKQQHQLENNTLDYVSEHFLQDHKIDLPAKEMFRLYATGRRGQNPELISEIGQYCLKDTELPLRLIHKLNVIPSMMEMAAANTVPLDFLLQRGQSVRCFSMVVKKMHDYDIICPSVMYTGEGAYEGATVIEPTKGAYWGPIAVCDYASLYPSIIRSNSLCPSRLVVDPKYAHLPGMSYLDVEVSDSTYRYAVSNDASIPPAVLPVLLEELAALRKQANAEKTVASDPWQKNLLDAKQKAIKVSMNSVYGVFGAERGFLTCQPLASSVTSIGRQMINTTKRMIEERFPGTEVIYGDSVAEYTPILVKDKFDRVRVMKVMDIGDEFGEDWYARSDGKQVAPVFGCQVWSDQGWTTVQQAVRHVLGVKKTMVRVVTRSGVVDVTSDHSLLRIDCTEVRPSELQTGEGLLHSSYPYASDTVSSTRVEVGSRLFIDQVDCAAAFLHARATGLHVTLDTVEQQHIELTATRRGDTIGKHLVEKVIPLTTYSATLVYDLTTANHHFQAGVGDIIVHNTDSVMIKFPGDDPYDAFERGAEAADMMTKHFKAPVKLELEKVFNPYLLFAKKQYAGLQYSAPDTPPTLNIKGLGVVRRDSCRFVKEASLRVLNSLLYDRDVEAAKSSALRDADALLGYKVDPQLLYLSRKLNSAYKNDNLAQVRIRDKMVQRVRDGTSQTAPPQPGDRVKFVYANLTKNKKATAGDKAEDPAWLLEKYPTDWKKKIDVEYYFTNCFSNPIMTYLKLVDPGVGDFFKETLQRYVLKRDKQSQITRFFKTTHTTS